MRNTKKYDQNIQDFVLANYGSLAGIGDFIKRNGLINPVKEFNFLKDGTDLDVDKTEDNFTLNSYKKNEYIPITGDCFTFIEITYPALGTNLTEFDTIDIKWNSDLTGTVKIELFKGSNLHSTIVSSTANSGTYSWYIDNSIVTDDYTIKISSLEYPEYYDISELFTINKFVPVISISEPNSSSNWLVGNQTILWTSNFADNVNIYLYKGGVYDSDIALNIANSGSFSWSMSGVSIAGTDYQIKIERASDPLIYSLSDNFEIRVPITTNINLEPLSNKSIGVTVFDGNWASAVNKTSGDGMSSSYNDNYSVYGLNYGGGVLYNERAFIKVDLTGITGTVISATMHLNTITNENHYKAYLYKGLQGSSIELADYSAFGQVLTNKSDNTSTIQTFVFNQAGLDELNKKGVISFMIRNEYDSELVTPPNTNTLTFQRLSSYLEIQTI